MKLTEPMVRALRALAVDGWLAGAGVTKIANGFVAHRTAMVLEREGLVRYVSNGSVYVITPAGRAWLAANTESKTE